MAKTTETSFEDSKRVERIRAHIAHLRKSADEIAPIQVPSFKDASQTIERESSSVGRLRRQAQDLEDILEGRADERGNPK